MILTAAAAGATITPQFGAERQHRGRKGGMGHPLLEQQVWRYIMLRNALIIDLHQMLAEHQPIVRAIVAGDRKRAEKLAHDHHDYNAPEIEKAAPQLVRDAAAGDTAARSRDGVAQTG